MPIRLRYGLTQVAELDIAEETLLAPYDGGADEPESNVVQLVRDALADPLEYPPLASILAPGDHVVLVPDADLPRGEGVLAAIVAELIAAGVVADRIVVPRTEDDQRRLKSDFRDHLPDEIAAGVRVVTHDPSDRKQLALLANREDGEPVVLNRLITDADLVIPIGRFQGRITPDHFGLFNCLYPRFSDEESRGPFRVAGLLDIKGKATRRLAKLVDQVAWLLGVMFTLQIIPGPRGRPGAIIAGQADAVRAECNRVYRERCRHATPSRASLVITSIEGDASQQTWESLVRALRTAAEAVEDRGVIALCTEIDAEPETEGLQMLQTAASREEARAWIDQRRPLDLLAALELADVLDRAEVYLMSRLDPAIVEQFDMIPIADATELSRLAGQHETCLIIDNGSSAEVAVEGE